MMLVSAMSTNELFQCASQNEQMEDGRKDGRRMDGSESEESAR
jgi:hypothetical protein